jgi:hypothetical protein
MRGAGMRRAAAVLLAVLACVAFSPVTAEVESSAPEGQVRCPWAQGHGGGSRSVGGADGWRAMGTHSCGRTPSCDDRFGAPGYRADGAPVGRMSPRVLN